MGAWGDAWNATKDFFTGEGTITTGDPAQDEDNITAKCGAKPVKPSGYDQWVAAGRKSPTDSRDSTALIGE